MMFFLGKGVAICYVASDIVEWKNCYKYQKDKRCLTVIYQAWDAVFFITRWNTEKRVENTTRSGVFFANFEVFHLVMKKTASHAWYYFSENWF